MNLLRHTPTMIFLLFFLSFLLFAGNRGWEWSGLSFKGDRRPVALLNSSDFEYPNSGDWGYRSQKASELVDNLNIHGFHFKFIGVDRTLVSVFRHPVEREIIPAADPQNGSMGTFFSHLQQICDAYELRFEVSCGTNIYLYPLFPLRSELEEEYGHGIR